MLIYAFALTVIANAVTLPQDSASPVQPETRVQKNLNAVLSEDGARAACLESSLAKFLTAAREGEFPTDLVDPEELTRYGFYYKGLKGLGSGEDFDPPRVLKSYSHDSESYRITVAFTGVRADAPFLYKIVEILATPEGDGYRFGCPFPQNTDDFRTQTVGSVNYHFRGELNIEAAAEFDKFKTSFAKLTGTPNEKLDYYAFRSLDELLKSYGFLFDAAKCNFLAHDLGFSDNGGRAFITGTANPNYVAEHVYEHVKNKLPEPDKIYRPFLTGLSVYYGGYFTSGDSLEDLKAQFREKLAFEPDTNFLTEFKKGRGSSIQRHFCHYVISSFLAEQVIERYGVRRALELTHSGSEGEHFFERLEQILGVNESNFHESIVRWIGAKS